MEHSRGSIPSFLRLLSSSGLAKRKKRQKYNQKKEQMGWGSRWNTVGAPSSAFKVFCGFFHLGRPVLGLGVRLALPVEEEAEWGERAAVCG